MLHIPRRWPLIPTGIVLLLAATMVMLGFWQLARHQQKQDAIAAISANFDRPAVTYPKLGPVARDILFRRSSLYCLRVEGWTREAGKAADGSAGYRYIAQCNTGAEGPGALVTIGVGGRPDIVPTWQGGPVEGRIVEEPDHASLLARWAGSAPVLRPMLVAEHSPDPQLKTPASPSIAAIPNNHMAYAVQWFIFAGLAVIIYGLALGYRQGKSGDGSHS